jgi:hypothetical protein
MQSQGPTGGLGRLCPITSLGVRRTPCLVVMPHHAWSAVQHRFVESMPLPTAPERGPTHGAAPQRGTIATWPHVLQVMMTSSAHMSHRCLDNMRTCLGNS